MTEPSELASEELSLHLSGYIGRAIGGRLRGFAVVDARDRGVAPSIEAQSSGSCQPSESSAGDSFAWLRKANDEPDRRARRAVSSHTQQATACRGYILRGVRASPLRHVSECVEGTRLVSPTLGCWPAPSSARGNCKDAALEPDPSWAARPTELTVMQDTVFSVATKIVRKQGLRCAAVNAASAYHAGGGFTTGGRHALEEAMCVQSTLFESLARGEDLASSAGVCAPIWARPARRRDGSMWHCHIPDDGAVLSPLVEVFREGSDRGYRFEDAPTALEGVISVAMPNCNERMGDSPVDAHPEPAEYEAQLRRKWRAALAAAAYWTQAECLVVPDAGCGVFRNPPGGVGRALGEVLREEFHGRFAQVVVAFPGGPAGEEFSAAAMGAFYGNNAPATKVRAAACSNVTPTATSRAKGYVWEFSVQDGFKPFNSETQAMVEAKYQVYLSLTPSLQQNVSVAHIPMGDKTVVVNFKTWRQHILGSAREREVQRRTLR